MSRFTRGARCRVSGQQDVGHEGVITGRDAFSLRSSIPLIPKESPSLHSNQPFLRIFLLEKIFSVRNRSDINNIQIVFTNTKKPVFHIM
ncbi:hypothetical protein ABE61_13690 [Lysinibacillus sphaericus]|nr:hypothetical protein [Lysinibacillus sphaericus]MBG9478623.1 hypothetical protein [Lysinibacillus sphaericus]MBG9592350.1 hypothetical protein [Lysinibacillus sphaericus]